MIKIKKYYLTILIALTLQPYSALSATIKIVKQKTGATILSKNNTPNILLSSVGNIDFRPKKPNATNFAAIRNTVGIDNLSISINAQEGKGIASLRSAVDINNSRLSSLNLVSGTIVGGSVDGHVVNLNNLKGDNRINVGELGNIANASKAGGHTINYIGSQASSLVINNNGSSLEKGEISGGVNTASRAIFFNNASANLVINNSGGVIAANDVAIEINNSSSFDLNNSNSNFASIINGAIINNGAGETRINNGSNGLITGDITLGSNANSFVNLNGGKLFGDLTFGNDAQSLVISNSGEFNGTINSAGTITIGENSTLKLNSSNLSALVNSSNESENSLGSLSIEENQNVVTNTNIGLQKSIASTSIKKDATLNIADNNNSISSSIIELNQNSSLIVGGGQIIGNVVSGVDGSANSTIEFRQNNDLAGSVKIGDGSISLADEKTLNLGKNDIIAEKIIIGQNSTLNVSDGVLDAKIETRVNNSGSVNFLENFTLSQDIGNSENAISSVFLSDGKVLNLDNKVIKAFNVVIGNGSVINAGASQIEAKNITLSSQSAINTQGLRASSDLSLNQSSKVYFNSGTLSSSINGSGIVFVNEDQDVITDSDIAVDLISLAKNSSLNLAENDKSLLSAVVLEEGSVITIGSKVVNGNISSSKNSENLGEVIFTQSNSLNGTINNVDKISLAANKTLTLSPFGVSSHSFEIAEGAVLNSSEGRIESNFNLGDSSNLNIGDNSRIIGSISGNGSLNIEGKNILINSVIGSKDALNSVNVSSSSQVIFNANIAANNINYAGEVSLASLGSVIDGNLNSTNSSASLNLGGANHQVNGNIILVSGSSLLVDINNNSAGAIAASDAVSLQDGVKLKLTIADGVIKKGSSYKIISGDESSNISAISKDNILINGISTRFYNNLKFLTKVESDQLFLNFAARDIIGKNSSQKNIYYELSEIKQAFGNLLALKNLVDSMEDQSQVEQIIESAAPQVDNSSHRLSFANSNDSINLTSQRLSGIRGGIASGDSSVKNSLWGQTFGSKINQGNSLSSQGYKASSYGFAFGADNEINDTVRGLSLSYANSEINSIDKLKRTKVDSYQINLYGSRNFENFFVNAMIGFAYNQYNSYRQIPSVTSNATAKYSGQTYISKLEIGNDYKLASEFIFTPNFTITAAKNKINDYSENGAGSLDLEVKNKDSSFFEARFGGEIAKDFAVSKENKIRPKLSLSYGYDFAAARQKTSSRFVGQSSNFASSSANMPQGSLRFGGGLTILNKDSFSLDIDYSFDKRTNYQAHSGALKAKYEF